ADACVATVPPFCDPADPDLIACFDLDGDVVDRSASHLDQDSQELSNVSFTEGVCGQGLQVGSNSLAHIGDTFLPLTNAVTVELWVKPTTDPNYDALIVDADGQFSVNLNTNREIECGFAGFGGTANTGAHLAQDQWTHVACRYDGMHVAGFVNGQPI